MKKYLIVILVLALFGCSKSKEAKKTQTYTQPSREVTSVKSVQKEINSYTSYSGKLVAENIVNISPVMSAKIDTLKVTEGMFVKKGQLLVVFDNNQLKQTETQFANLKKNYERMKTLYKSNSIDQKSFEEVETGYITMKESLDFLRENTDIVAPIDGVISKITAKEGEIFNTMMNPFFIRIVNLDKMKVIVNISDVDIVQIAIGQKAILSVNNIDYFGKVSYISPEADMMSGTFPCEITINNPKNELKHNQFAKVKIVTQSSK